MPEIDQSMRTALPPTVVHEQLHFIRRLARWQELAKHLDKSDPGYEVVEDAIITMTAVAWYINDMKRKQEHAVRLQVRRAPPRWPSETVGPFLIRASPGRLWAGGGGRPELVAGQSPADRRPIAGHARRPTAVCARNRTAGKFWVIH